MKPNKRYTYLECENGHRYRNKGDHNFSDCPICGAFWKERITKKKWIQLNEKVFYSCARIDTPGG